MAPTSGQAVAWTDIVQVLGIVSGFALTIRELRVSTKLRKFDVFWRIGESHREVWRALLDIPSLARVLQEQVDLKSNPLTDQEEVFVNSVVIHVENAYDANLRGYYSFGDHEIRDIRAFFGLPLPAAAWERIKEFQPRSLVKFIDDSPGPTPGASAESKSNSARVEQWILQVCAKSIEWLTKLRHVIEERSIRLENSRRERSNK